MTLPNPLGRCFSKTPSHRGLPFLRRGCAAATVRPFSARPTPGFLRVSAEVVDAVAHNKPVVALESTIYTHGALPRDLAREHHELLRSQGCIPAIVAIVDGAATVGVVPEEIARMIQDGNAIKASRRDVSHLVGMGLLEHRVHGGTTISATMLLARLAGIRIFATGGLGGVHRGGESSMDVSADLTELGRTRMAVICSGCKGFLDIPRTLEYLETQGCLVATFTDGRSGNVDFPAFWARDSGVRSPSIVSTEREAAAMILAQERLGLDSGLLFANPIPEQSAIPGDEMEASIQQAVREATELGFTGNSNTPFILRRIRELVGDKAYLANTALVKANIIRASVIAVELSRLLRSSLKSHAMASSPTPPPSVRCSTDDASVIKGQCQVRRKIFVAGSIALDLSCDLVSENSSSSEPVLHTSNPASFWHSVGGVGHNVALAAHLVSRNIEVYLGSLVGDDLSGRSVLDSIRAAGMNTTYVRMAGSDSPQLLSTAQHVAVNGSKKDLLVGMADMAIFTHPSSIEHCASAIASVNPDWLVIDGNWGSSGIRSLIQSGKRANAKIALEPVSVTKSQALFGSHPASHRLNVFPQAGVDLATPNKYELGAMHATAQENGYFESKEWFEVINSFGMRGARDRFVRLASAELTDDGIPIQAVRLLPYIPTIITKLGPKGILLTMILSRDDPLLQELDAKQFMLARTGSDDLDVGGVYMRLFPPAQVTEDIVSVNGAGDSFLGVLISGLVQGARLENLIEVAQKAAVASLTCKAAVNPNLGILKNELSQAICR